MRILSLDLPRFKNLRDFHIDFDEKSEVSVLVGRNGAGKSNVLEALTLIFRDLDLRQPAKFDYRIKYECKGHVVEVEGLAGERSVRATSDGLEVASNKV